MDYDGLGREELIARIEELETLSRQLLEDQHREVRLDFAWAGNLGHWYFDLRTNSVTFNPLKAAALGYSMDELPGRVPYQFFTRKVHPDDHAMTMKAMLDHMHGLSPVYEVEYRIRTKDGAYKWFYDRGSITERNADGSPAFVAGIVFDITRRKELQLELEAEIGRRARAENDLRAAKEAVEANAAELERHRDHLEELVHVRTMELATARDEAESANRAKSAFLSTMSHEMRTPLNHIMGMGHLLERSLAEGPARDRLAIISKASRKMLEMVDDILEYTDLEAGRIAIADSDFALARMLDDAMAGVREKAAAKGIELVPEVDPALPGELRGDPARLAHVLALFLDNAVKYSDGGRVILRARSLGAGASGVRVRFEVQDHGIGITPELQPGLFQVFAQGDGSWTRKYQGTGLGLALAKRLVALMGGEIGVDSVPGEGSTFRFSVRLRAAGRTGGRE